MANVNINIIPNDVGQENTPYQVYSQNDLNLIEESLSQSEFDPNDPSNNIELNIYDEGGNLIRSVFPFTDYTVENDSNTNGKVGSLVFDTKAILSSLGLTFGVYRITYRFLKNRLDSSLNEPNYFISDLSPNRQEIRVNSNTIKNEDLIPLITDFSSSLNDNNTTFNDFYIQFGEGQLYIANNILLESSSLGASFLIHLYEPLPDNIEENNEFSIVTQQADPLDIQIDLPYLIPSPEIDIDNTIKLKGPNFTLNENQVLSTPTTFKNLSELNSAPQTTNSNFITSSYNQLQNLLNSKGISLDLDYNNFDNFIHFSSAKERLNNFYYKVTLIESASAEIEEKYSDSTNLVVSSSKAEIEKTITSIIENFDGYENFLYYESNSLAWPKSNDTYPYTLHSTGSAEVLEWFGSDLPTSQYYGGIILSASNYDNSNPNQLVKTIPEYLREDPNNLPYDLFINMMGQHFDTIYYYTQQITSRFDGDNRLKFGISKDLVAQAIRDFGIKLYQNNFTTNDLYGAFLGIESGTNSTAITGSELINNFITASSDIIPLNDVNSTIYKRLYHNMPYLLKKKGTVEGLRVLINCFGIPDTTLRISEFGGKDKEENNNYDYFYNKYSRAITTGDGVDFAYVQTPWLPLTAKKERSSKWIVPDAVQFRFKTNGIPTPSNFSQSLWLVGTDGNELDKKESFNIGLFLYYRGDSINDGEISYGGKDTSKTEKYGGLQLVISGSGQYVSSSEIILPFFNEEPWSVEISRNVSTDLDNLNQLNVYTLKTKQKLYKGNDGTVINPPSDSPPISEGSAQIVAGLNALGTSVNYAWSNFNTNSAITTESIYTHLGNPVPPTAVQIGAGLGSRFGFSGKQKTGGGRMFVKDETYFSGSIQEIRYYSITPTDNIFDDFVANPESIEGQNLTGSLSSFDILNFRAAGGNELSILENNNQGTGSIEGGPPNNFLLFNSIHPSITASSDLLITSSFVIANPEDNPASNTDSNGNFYQYQSQYLIRDDQEFIDGIFTDKGIFANKFEETYLVDQPVAGIRNRVTEKIKQTGNMLPGNVLSPISKIEQNNAFKSGSYTKDINYLEVAFSPQNELNDDIAANLGSFQLGEYIGDPRLISQSLTSYPDLDDLREDYFKKYFKNYNVKDYIRLIKFFDNSLFKMIKDFVPARTGVASGVVIKQHLLERNRYPVPIPSSSQHVSTASIDTAFITGSTGGALNTFNTVNFPQVKTFTAQGPSGSTLVSNTDQLEFYNGEFEGTNIQVISGSPPNPYLSDKFNSLNYELHLYSGAKNRHIRETTFTQNFTLEAGEIHLYYITASVPSFNPGPSDTDTFIPTYG